MMCLEPVHQRYGDLGHQYSYRWGSPSSTSCGDRIGHAGTLISAILVCSAKPGVIDQPFRRSHDAVRGCLRRHLSARAHGALACVLALSYPTPCVMANFRSPLVWDVVAVSTYDDFARVLVRRTDPDFATCATNRKACGCSAFTDCRHDARFGRTGTAMDGLLAACGSRDAAVLSVHTSSASISRRIVRAGTRRSFRRYFVAGAIIPGFAMSFACHSDPSIYGLKTSSPSGIGEPARLSDRCRRLWYFMKRSWRQRQPL